MDKIFTQILGVIANIGQTLNKLLGQVGTSAVAGPAHYNWLLIGFILFVVFLVGFTLGRTRMLLALIAIYTAAFIESHFVYFARLQTYLKSTGRQIPEYYIHIGLLIVLYLIIFMVLNRSILKGRLAIKEASIFAISLEAILIVGLMTSIVVTYLPADVIKQLPAGILKYFLNKNAQFIWAVAPIVLALFLGGKSRGFHD